jgi:Tfp pilus assembly protein PilV
MTINSQVIHRYKKSKGSKTDQGFSILEAAIALTTLGVTLAYAMPLFLYSKMNNSKSEVRTGAMMVAQRILDQTRGTPFGQIPNTGNVELVDGTTADLQAMGRTYSATTYHCETATECSDNYKTLRVEVKQNGSTIYEMDAGFTNFR